jgi:cytochrome oxidase Cu insertion factor (SCO1/SenC/PrrC family)
MRRLVCSLSLLLFWVPSAGAQAKDTKNSGPAVGKRAPEITGEDIDGKKFKLSDYRGKVVLLDFWGNW